MRPSWIASEAGAAERHPRGVTGDRIDRVVIAYGGVAPTVIRLPCTEVFLAGKPPRSTPSSTPAASPRDEIKPISAVGGSSNYRLQLAENVMAKFWFDVFAQ